MRNKVGGKRRRKSARGEKRESEITRNKEKKGAMPPCLVSDSTPSLLRADGILFIPSREQASARFSKFLCSFFLPRLFPFSLSLPLFFDSFFSQCTVLLTRRFFLCWLRRIFSTHYSRGQGACYFLWRVVCARRIVHMLYLIISEAEEERKPK